MIFFGVPKDVERKTWWSCWRENLKLDVCEHFSSADKQYIRTSLLWRRGGRARCAEKCRARRKIELSGDISWCSERRRRGLELDVWKFSVRRQAVNWDTSIQRFLTPPELFRLDIGRVRARCAFTWPERNIVITCLQFERAGKIKQYRKLKFIN